jgi:hypothetical protein
MKRFLLVCLMVTPTTLLGNAFSYQNGVAVDLGNVSPLGVNDAGQIIETAGTSLYLVQGASSIQIGLPGSTSDYGHLNNMGQVAGESLISGVYHPFLYSQGSIIDLTSYVPSGQAVAYAEINNAGQVLLTTESTTTPLLFSNILITNGSAQNIGSVNLTGQSAGLFDAFNANDVIVGSSGVPPYGDPPYTSFFYIFGVATTFNTLDPTFNFDQTYPRAINDLGEVIGDSNFGPGYLYSNSTFTSLNYAPTALSNSGDFIAGSVEGITAGRDFSLNGTSVDLRIALGDNASIVINNLVVTGVNDSGEVVGTFGQTTAAPEPKSGLLVVMGLIGGSMALMWLRRGRRPDPSQFAPTRS